mgnify:CR=1 FL=1
MKRALLLTSCFVFILLCTNSTRSQSNIEVEKRRLITELLTLTKTDQEILLMGDAVLRGMEESDRKTLLAALDQTSCKTDKQLKECDVKVAESYSKLTKKFRDQLPEEVNYQDYIQKSVYPMYDKYFSISELQDLVAFYKSLTGRKMVAVMPRMYMDAADALKPFTDKMIKLLDRLRDAEVEALSKASKPR